MPKKRLTTEQLEEQRRCDALALAQLIYDIYKEKKAKEQDEDSRLLR